MVVISILLYGIIGADGFSREVMPVARGMIYRAQSEQNAEIVFVEKDPVTIRTINGHRVFSEDEFTSYPAEEKYFNIAIADYKIRERIANRFLANEIMPFQIRADNTVIYDDNKIGVGAVLCPFTTVTSNVEIGRFFHANIYSYVAHDCIIGDFVTFAPNVNCNGRVVVEDYAYIGTGTVIKQGSMGKPIVIGKGAVVGMGSVVTKSVSPYTTVIGNPARVINEM